MAEVFECTPAIVSVTIADQEGKQVSYHVAGRDMGVVSKAVKSAIALIPDEDAEAPIKPHNKRHRRTKAEIAASMGKARDEAGALPVNGKAWPG